MKINEKNLCMFAITPPVDLEGWLSKRGEVNKSWQRRYFILKGNLLFYFDKKGEKEPLGVIILEGCTVELAEDGEQYCFQVVFNGVNNRIYVLSAESQDIMEQWMKALTCAGYEYMKLMVAELQRQLDEIEGSTKGISSPQNTPVAPKPPPRRHNPFNKPVPNGTTTPIKANGSTTNLLNIIDHSIKLGSSPSSSLSSNSSATTTTIPHNPIPAEEEFTFLAVHEAFGRQILRDFREHEQSKALAENPLIDL